MPQITGTVTQDVRKGDEWTQSEAEQVEMELRKRAVKDPEFRALALRDPQAAIAKITPKPLPKNFKVKVVENEGANVVVVLPDPIGRVEELSDADLEAVAGGSNRNNNNRLK
jgi:hypothetical protein